MTIYGRRGRIEAPIDRTIDPSRASRAGGFLRSTADRGRIRATALPNVRAGIGDFGPLLYYTADDATIEGGVLRIPNRTGVNAPIYSQGTAPTLAAFMPNDPILSSDRSVVFADGATTQLLTTPLGTLLAANLAGTFEVVFTLVVVSAPAADRMLVSNVEDVTGFGAGSFANQLFTTRVVRTTRAGGAGADVRDSARLPVGVPRIFHMVIRSTQELDTFINGVPASHAVAGPGGSVVWAGDQFSIGADSSGTFRSPAVRIRDIAIYPRELTRDERMAMFAGAFNANASILQYPRVEDFLDVGASFTTWHPDRDPVVASGGVLESDSFENQGVGATRAVNALGRWYVSPDGVTDSFVDAGPGFATTAADDLVFFVAFMETSGVTRNFAALPYEAGADHIELDNGTLRADFQTGTVSLGALGALANKHVACVVRVTTGVEMKVRGGAWNPGDAAYTAASGTAACGTTPVATALMRLCTDSGGGASMLEGKIFGAGAYVGNMTDHEAEAVIRYFFQEHNT